MFNYTYMTRSNSKFYIGSHSTSNLNDGYQGSGKWIKQMKNRKLTTKIIKFYDSVDEMRFAEERLIKKHINKDSCMNWIHGARGLTTHDVGERTPMFGKKQSIKQRQAVKKNMLVNNPMKKEENKKYGESNPNYGKPSPHRRPVEYKGVKYNSVKEMSEAIGLTRGACRYRLRQEV